MMMSPRRMLQLLLLSAVLLLNVVIVIDAKEVRGANDRRLAAQSTPGTMGMGMSTPVPAPTKTGGMTPGGMTPSSPNRAPSGGSTSFQPVPTDGVTRICPNPFSQSFHQNLVEGTKTRFCSVNLDCADFTANPNDGAPCCLYPQCLCGPRTPGSQVVRCTSS